MKIIYILLMIGLSITLFSNEITPTDDISTTESKPIIHSIKYSKAETNYHKMFLLDQNKNTFGFYDFTMLNFFTKETRTSDQTNNDFRDIIETETINKLFLNFLGYRNGLIAGVTSSILSALMIPVGAGILSGITHSNPDNIYTSTENLGLGFGVTFLVWGIIFFVFQAVGYGMAGYYYKNFNETRNSIINKLNNLTTISQKKAIKLKFALSIQ